MRSGDENRKVAGQPAFGHATSSPVRRRESKLTQRPMKPMLSFCEMRKRTIRLARRPVLILVALVCSHRGARAEVKRVEIVSQVPGSGVVLWPTPLSRERKNFHSARVRVCIFIQGHRTILGHSQLRLRSVSYTHLDVYKRQVQAFVDNGGPHVWWESPVLAPLNRCAQVPGESPSRKKPYY